MENIRLTLNEKVLLDAMLYQASKSDQLKKSRKTARMLFAVIIVLAGGLLMYSWPLIGLMVLIIGAVFFIFFPKYLAFYYKRYMARAVKSSDYKNRVGQFYDISFGDEYMEIKNDQMEAKYYFSNFEYITETSEHFFIKLKGADFLIFPKAQIQAYPALKTFFKNICTNQGIAYCEEYDWQWS